MCFRGKLQEIPFTRIDVTVAILTVNYFQRKFANMLLFVEAIKTCRIYYNDITFMRTKNTNNKTITTENNIFY